MNFKTGYLKGTLKSKLRMELNNQIFKRNFTIGYLKELKNRSFKVILTSKFKRNFQIKT